jgi:hypothetical protein
MLRIAELNPDNLPAAVMFFYMTVGFTPTGEELFGEIVGEKWL